MVIEVVVSVVKGIIGGGSGGGGDGDDIVVGGIIFSPPWLFRFSSGYFPLLFIYFHRFDYISLVDFPLLGCLFSL